MRLFNSFFFYVFFLDWIGIVSTASSAFISAKGIEFSFEFHMAIIAKTFHNLFEILWRYFVSNWFHSFFQLTIHRLPSMVHVAESLFANWTPIFSLIKALQAALMHGMTALQHRTAFYRIKQPPQTCSTVLLKRIFETRMISNICPNDAHIALVAVSDRCSGANSANTTALAMKNLLSRRRIIGVTNGAAIRRKQNAALWARVRRILLVPTRNTLELGNLESVHFLMTKTTSHKLVANVTKQQAASFVMRTVCNFVWNTVNRSRNLQ